VDPSEIANVLLHLPSELVAGLKAAAQSRYTTFETVSAHLWRKITLHGGEELEPTVGDDDNVLLPDVDSDSWLHLLDFGCGGRLAGILSCRRRSRCTGWWC
jgi:hypothetical protein